MQKGNKEADAPQPQLFVLLALAMLAVAVVIHSLRPAGDEGAQQPPPYTSGPLYYPDPVFLEKYARIQEELKTATNPPWAGYYQNFNSTLVTKVWVAPKNGWLETSQGCFGGWLRSGIVREGAGLIQLGPEVETMEADFGVLREVGLKSILDFDNKPPTRKAWCLGTERGLLLKVDDEKTVSAEGASPSE